MADKTKSNDDILFTHPEHYQAIENCWMGLTEEDKKSFDPAVTRVIDLLNTHPSITTVMSCEGHFSKPPKMPNAWISMAVKDKAGVDFLQRMHSVLTEEIIERYYVFVPEKHIGGIGVIKPNNFSLIITQQAMPNYIPGYAGEFTWYRAFRLNAVLPPQDRYREGEKQWYFNRLEEYLTDNLPTAS